MLKQKLECIENIIIRRISLGRNVNPRHIHHYYSWLEGAVRRSDLSMKNIIERCGKKYNHILKNRNWSKDDVIFDVISAEQKNIDISSIGLRTYDKGLGMAAYRLFKDGKFPFISNHDWMLINCGINPESVGRRKWYTSASWAKFLVLYELREHVAQNRSSSWLESNGFLELTYAVRKHGGGFRKAVSCIKQYESDNLFEKSPEFKLIQEYKDTINNLRNVSKEGRVRVKRNRSYVINLDKHAKPIRLATLKHHLKTLDDYLLPVDELKTNSQVRKDTNIPNDVLMAATPTRTIDCIRCADLIRELDKKYYARGWKYFGRKPVGRTIFYYSRNREEELKEKWAQEHMAKSKILDCTRVGGIIR